MGRLSTLAFLAPLFISTSSAQNNTRPTCSDLGTLLRYNASTTRQIPAFYISGERSAAELDPNMSFAVNNDTSKNWTLSMRVHDADQTKAGRNQLSKQTVLLDTMDSNVTQMGVCHNTISAGGYDAFAWTKEVLERSLKDDGDCKTMLGEKCLHALLTHYRKDAAGNSLRSGNCGKANNTVPLECAGMMQPSTQSKQPSCSQREERSKLIRTTIVMNMTQDLSNYNSLAPSNTTTRFVPTTSCNGLNTSSNHAVDVSINISYSTAIRFPLVDIITFWPNRSSGFQSYRPSWLEDVQARAFCMTPNRLEQGSVVPRTQSFTTSREPMLCPRQIPWLRNMQYCFGRAQ
jgi:hypothetical protein